MNKAICFLLISSLLVNNSCDDVDEHLPDVVKLPKKLDYFVDSYNSSDAGFDARTKVKYEYTSSGKVSKYTAYNFDEKSGREVEQLHHNFIYKADTLKRIEAFQTGSNTPYQINRYTYQDDGKVLLISQTDSNSGVNSEVRFLYGVNEMIKVYYVFSNGGSFEYEFKYINQNIISDKTIKGSQLCSDGAYTYDDHINPLGNLGYVDYLLTTLSANNKLTENVSHVNCSFPTLVPISYSYEYDKDGYPEVVTITYKSTNNAKKSKRQYYYK